MGYTDFNQNLLRLRKFKEDHINQVLSDYADNSAEKVEQFALQPSTSFVDHQVP